MKTNDIRKKWVSYFETKKHLYLEPLSLVPKNDPSLLWINSGVATLKNYFDGSKKPPCKRLVNVQRVLRTNDIENIGLTARHHTFFEMLGNFSIGDYFKKDAILMAWEFLTTKKGLNIDSKKLYVTIFNDDKQTYDIWLNEIKIAKEKIVKLGRKTNFWDVGSGPCGPSTEIFFDRGNRYDKRGIELLKKDIENNRFIEIWNIVFSEFNNNGDNNYTKLNQKNIDTGAGLERLSCVLQDVETNFEIDIFQDIIKAIEKFTKVKYNGAKNKEKVAFKIIADHLRGVVFAIADKQLPENSGRGYVLKKLIRRSLNQARRNLLIEINDDFLPSIAKAIVKTMCDFYPYLNKEITKITKVLIDETKSYLKLENNYKMINDRLAKKGSKFNEIDAFFLYETYGIPLEVIKEFAENEQIKLNDEKIKQEMTKHSKKAQSSRKLVKGMQNQVKNVKHYSRLLSKFVGYDCLRIKTNIISIEYNNKIVDQVKGETNAIIIVEQCPFYATSGGQLHDIGTINETILVNDVIKDANGNHLLFVFLPKETKLTTNQEIVCQVDINRRNKTSINHSCTHLLFSVIENKINDVVEQSGAYYDANYLRFDFYTEKEFKKSYRKEINEACNVLIKKGLRQKTIETSLQNAKAIGATLMKGEEYGDMVRVVMFGENIKDLCGGTHVSNTKEIEEVFIKKIDTVGKNKYRIEAVTTKETIAYAKNEMMKVVKENQITPYLNSISQIKARVSNQIIIKKLTCLVDELIYLEKTYDFDNIKTIVEKVSSNLVKIEKEINEDLYQKVKQEILQKTYKPFKNILYIVEVKDIPMVIFKRLAFDLLNKFQSPILLINNRIEKISFVILDQKSTKYDFMKMIIKNKKELKIRGGGPKFNVQGELALKDKAKFIEVIKCEFLV